jgi:hypothetical protein
MRTPSHRVESGGNNTTKPGANKPGRVIPDGTAEWVVSGARKGLKKKKVKTSGETNIQIQSEKRC